MYTVHCIHCTLSTLYTEYTVHCALDSGQVNEFRTLYKVFTGSCILYSVEVYLQVYVTVCRFIYLNSIIIVFFYRSNLLLNFFPTNLLIYYCFNRLGVLVELCLDTLVLPELDLGEHTQPYIHLFI